MGTGDTNPPAPNPSGGTTPVGTPPTCPAGTNADLTVTVTRRGDNAAVEGARVRIRGPRRRSSRTASSGQTTFRGIRPGSYEVTGSKRHYSTETTNATVACGPPSQAALQLTAQTELVVRVREVSTREPIEGATVHIAGPSAVADQRTDRDGQARFTQILPGEYTITATKQRFRQEGVVAVQVEPGRTRVDVRMHAASRLRGTITDRDTNNPIEGATVTLKEKDDLSVQTNADGEYNFGDVDIGDYHVQAHREGFEDASERVRMRVQDEHMVNLRMRTTLSIAANQDPLTVVLDAAGAAAGGHPVLEFNITGGPPNYLIDVQVQRGGTDSLSGGPGLAGAWNSGDTRQNRQGQRSFSSWTHGDRAIPLDGNGAATYTMPLEWWRDLARQPLDSFSSETVRFRVLAFPDAASRSRVYSTTDARRSRSPRVELRNNLTRFRVYRLRYHPDGGTVGRWRRYARIEFHVRESNTRNMYNMVQWKRGGRTWDDGSVVWGVQDYGQVHASDYPQWQIDWLENNPRYWDGNPTDADDKTAYYEDDPSCGPVPAGRNRVDTRIDFVAKMHVDFDIPAAVTIDAAATTHLPDGSLGVYRGTIDETQTLVLAERTWNAAMRVTRNAHGNMSFQQL